MTANGGGAARGDGGPGIDIGVDVDEAAASGFTAVVSCRAGPDVLHAASVNDRESNNTGSFITVSALGGIHMNAKTDAMGLT